MAKKNADRFDDSVDYIRINIDHALAAHIQGLAGGQKNQIGGDLSLGTRWDAFASRQSRSAKTEQRRALRALILCQRVYYSTLWPCLIGTQAASVNFNRLKPTWKNDSLQFWKNQTETAIREGIRMFIATSNNPADAARAAKEGHPGGSTMAPPLNATRATYSGEKTTTCYDAVMLWLFKSGLVSFRWLLRHRGANTKQTLTDAFGPGARIWQGDFKDTSKLPSIPSGFVVHIYEHEQSWRGHWMISTGNDGACGCNNNDETPPVPRTYCNTLSLHKQFLDYGEGAFYMINPLQIPERG